MAHSRVYFIRYYMKDTSMAKKKWTPGDIFTLSLQILTPISAIIFTSFMPKGQSLSPDIKLAIIGIGIAIPIIILQYSLIIGQNKCENDTQNLSKNINKVSNKITHISPILERVFLEGNDRAQRFVYRRMEKVIKTLQIALNNNNSGNLEPSEYYRELLYLAKLIISDKAEQKNNFKGEIWAMTSFADEEWIEDVGYEKLWTEKLSEMVKLGIKTRRICVVPDTIINLISGESFSEEKSENVSEFNGFINYIQTYYGTRSKSKKNIAEHYFMRSGDNYELTQIKGFFGIKLTSGESHILHGETINENGAITAKVLFDQSEINRTHELFELHARPTQELSKAIIKISEKNDFINYLTKKGVIFNL